VPFWNQNGIVWFSFFTVLNNTVLVPKRHKKYKIFIKSIFPESMAFKGGYFFLDVKKQVWTKSFPGRSMYSMDMRVSAFKSLSPEDDFTCPYHGHTTIRKFSTGS